MERYINCLLLIFILGGCQTRDQHESKASPDVTGNKQVESKKADSMNTQLPELVDELEGEDDYISVKNFKNWKGNYHYEYNIHDGYGRNSIINANVGLIKPDSSTLEFWLADEGNQQYTNDNNYFKIVGGLYGEEDSISFHYNKQLAGKYNEKLSPVFTLLKDEDRYFIKSMLTTPPHNGELALPIQKENK